MHAQMRMCVSQYPAQFHDLHEDMHWFPVIRDFYEDQIRPVGRAANQRYARHGLLLVKPQRAGRAKRTRIWCTPILATITRFHRAA